MRNTKVNSEHEIKESKLYGNFQKKKVEEIDFAKIVKEDATMLKGKKVVKQEGEKGKKEVSYLITEENGVRTERIQSEANVVADPENRIVVVGTKVIPSVGTGTFAWPAVGGYISSNMGERWVVVEPVLDARFRVRGG